MNNQQVGFVELPYGSAMFKPLTISGDVGKSAKISLCWLVMRSITSALLLTTLPVLFLRGAGGIKRILSSGINGRNSKWLAVRL
jgi:hypothetical protein